MNWIIVRRMPIDMDLSLVNEFLHQREIVHTIYEDNGEQVLAVADPKLVQPLDAFISDVLAGKVKFHQEPAAPEIQEPNLLSIIAQVRYVPITFLLIVFSVIGALLVKLDPGVNFYRIFTFQNVTSYSFVPFTESLKAGELWRLVTPAFLHFGFLHVLFNSMWVWDLGRRVELLLGKKNYIIFFIVTAAISNVAQYYWKSDNIFGGMSGFVYALIGFIVVSHKLAPHKLTAVPLSVFGFMFFWLLLCMTGAIDFLAGGGIANAAHVGGLLAGAAVACVTDKYIQNKIIDKRI